MAATEASHRCPTALLWRTALTVPVVFALTICRSTRGLLVPLKAADMQASHAVTGAIAAFSFVTDTAFFPAAGWLVDRKGRKWSGAPSLACMGVSYVLMSASSSQLQLLLCAALTGAGNGLSSGLVQTLGGALARARGRRRLGRRRAATVARGPLRVLLLRGARLALELHRPLRARRASSEETVGKRTAAVQRQRGAWSIPGQRAASSARPSAERVLPHASAVLLLLATVAPGAAESRACIACGDSS